ncbi:MAG: glycosyltransferase, partial [Acidobacteriota bacterium]|nr:glycosyltransferase [Acidobacteriota bacterium]
MKVLHIIDSGGLYGAEKMLIALTTGQVLADVQPCVCSIGLPGETEKPLERALRAAGIDVWPLRMRKGLNLVGGLALVREARNRGFDVLHTHGYKGNILLALLPRFLRGIPWVVTTHGWSHGAGSTRSRLYQWLDERAICVADRVVAVSESMLSLRPFARRGVMDRSTVITNAVSRPGTTGVVDKRIASFCEPSVTAAIVGRLDPVKGHSQLLQAMVGVRLRLLVLG